jgi:hypothetical protein
VGGATGGAECDRDRVGFMDLNFGSVAPDQVNVDRRTIAKKHLRKLKPVEVHEYPQRERSGAFEVLTTAALSNRFAPQHAVVDGLRSDNWVVARICLSITQWRKRHGLRH